MKTTTRRHFVTTLVAGAAASQIHRLSFASAPGTSTSCSLVAEQEVGPFYVPDELLRSNIAENKPGIPLALHILMLDAKSCKPLSNAAIDIWHCDASGLYSGYTTMKLGPPPEGGGPGGPPHDGHGGPPPDGPPGGGPPEMHPTDKLTFLRGIQRTGSDGSVAFQTIFPGFYQGRVNHIHFKVRVGGNAEGKTYAGGHTSHTGQIFFPEELAVKLMALEPYASHRIHRTTAIEDDIFQGQHGSQSVARLQAVHDLTDYKAEIVISVDPDLTPAPVNRAFGGPPSHG